MALTYEEIEKWATTKHLKLSAANSALLGGFFKSQGFEVTTENLERVITDPHFKFALDYEPGFEPKEAVAADAATPRRRADAFNEAIDSGHGAPKIDPTSTHSYREAHRGDDAKEFEARRAQTLAQQKATEQKLLQRAEESVTIFHDHGSMAGRINHAATNSARLEAKQKWASIRGVVTKPSN